MNKIKNGMVSYINSFSKPHINQPTAHLITFLLETIWERFVPQLELHEEKNDW